jgi:DNA primase
MRVSREGIDEIKRRNDLAEVVTEHGIELKKRGRTFFGLCPFHEEKTASFGVSREAGLFHCFGCGAGGDVIGFVVRFHQVTFPEALKRLADRAGLELEGLMESGQTLRSHGQSGLAQGDVSGRIATSRFERFAARGGRP